MMLVAGLVRRSDFGLVRRGSSFRASGPRRRVRRYLLCGGNSSIEVSVRSDVQQRPSHIQGYSSGVVGCVKVWDWGLRIYQHYGSECLL